jgi:hypothetical protein
MAKRAVGCENYSSMSTNDDSNAKPGERGEYLLAAS